MRALGHGKRHDAIDAESGEEQGNSRETGEEDERESLVGHGFVDDIIKGFGLRPAS
jgi:hypothetical protein